MPPAGGTTRLKPILQSDRAVDGYPCRPPCADISSRCPSCSPCSPSRPAVTTPRPRDESGRHAHRRPRPRAARRRRPDAPTEAATPGDPSRGRRGRQGDRRSSAPSRDHGPRGRQGADQPDRQGPQEGHGRRRPPPARPSTCQYTGVLFKDGTKFDASWDRGGQPFSFSLGLARSSPGWDQGIVGMKKGGRAPAGHPARAWATAPRARRGGRSRPERAARVRRRPRGDQVAEVGSSAAPSAASTAPIRVAEQRDREAPRGRGRDRARSSPGRRRP